MNGNIIANKGFISVFGTEITSAGAQNIPAGIVAAWAGVQSVGQMIGMLGVTQLSDIWGRKATFLAIFLFLTTVSVVNSQV